MRLRENEFKRWLESKPPSEIVGEKQDCLCCPIANFYKEATGGCDIIVWHSWGEVFIDRGDGDRRAPGWVEYFVGEVDDAEVDQITAAHALEILAA